ncbi:MarR family winged helix-turn-helix transcriptional regulator [Krasilnikoviella flava]|uniref:DNA-binding transcriptional regulator, MarR family n=1 Tax=Krasilnikoviella flava TaxID=526729 RepID=A0A1T5IEX4_9MICO|nr:MarR family transcriptional regulator [Krasilnikoviella flava]SKC37741.1 DNA-binding transcriptional regulator, MarR family [Krasilnikoviella flava]
MPDETIVTPGPGPDRRPPGACDLADLADVVVELARHLDVRSPELRDIVPLTGTEVAVIREVHRSARPTPSRIATATGLARSNVSTALRTLEARGLVVREHADGDRRTVRLVATSLADEHLARIHEFWGRRLGGVPDDVRDAALDALPALAALAEALVGPRAQDA